jgi:hypothetical protein
MGIIVAAIIRMVKGIVSSVGCIESRTIYDSYNNDNDNYESFEETQHDTKSLLRRVFHFLIR